MTPVAIGQPLASAVAEQSLLRRVRSVAHVDDPDRVRAYARLLADDSPSYLELSPVEQGFAHAAVLPVAERGLRQLRSGLVQLRWEAAARGDLRAVIDLAFDRSRRITVAPGPGVAAAGLRIHARYQREEILTALGPATQTNPLRTSARACCARTS